MYRLHDCGKEEYLDGVTCRYDLYGPGGEDDIIGYIFEKEEGEKIVKALNGKLR